jgi:hypothetical protein
MGTNTDKLGHPCFGRTGTEDERDQRLLGPQLTTTTSTKRSSATEDDLKSTTTEDEEAADW